MVEILVIIDEITTEDHSDFQITGNLLLKVEDLKSKKRGVTKLFF